MLRRILPWLGIAALVVAAVLTTDWGSGPSRTSHAQGPTRTPAPTRTPSSQPTSLSAVEAASLVRNLPLRRRELPAGFVLVPSRSGYRLAVPSLRLCGATFDSEHYRLGAHRVTYRSVHHEGRVVDTVVAYEHGYAAHALAELEAAAPRCTRAVGPGHLEQPDTLALRVRSTGGSRYDLVVERRGDVLSLLEVDGRQGYLTLDLARRLGNRLEALLP